MSLFKTTENIYIQYKFKYFSFKSRYINKNKKSLKTVVYSHGIGYPILNYILNYTAAFLSGEFTYCPWIG